MRIEDVVAQRIAEGRAELQLTQAQLGERLGEYLGEPWPRQAVSAAEKGERAFRAAELVAFALVLGCPIESLLEPPLEVEAVLLDGKPVDSRNLRSATGTNSDLAELGDLMTQLRYALRARQQETKADTRLMERAYRSLYDAVKGRGLQVVEEQLRRETRIQRVGDGQEQP